MKKNLFIIGTAAIMATACSTANKIGSTADLNGEWTVEKVNGTAIDKTAGDEIPFIGFDVNKKSIYGNTGCNRLTGTFDATADGLDLSKIGSTRMMCANMTNEQLVLGALANVNSFKTDKKGNLLLTDKQGKTVIELEKKK